VSSSPRDFSLPAMEEFKQYSCHFERSAGRQ